VQTAYLSTSGAKELSQQRRTFVGQQPTVTGDDMVEA
jgi:hypothetical protein